MRSERMMITKRFNKLLQRLVNDIIGWICGDKHVRCQRVDGWQHRAELLFQLLLQPGPQHATNAIAEHRQQHVVQPTARSNHECREHMRVQLAWCYATNLAAASVMDVVSEGSANSKLSCFSCGLPFTATIASRMLTLASLITQSHCPVQGPTVVPRLVARRGVAGPAHSTHNGATSAQYHCRGGRGRSLVETTS